MKTAEELEFQEVCFVATFFQENIHREMSPAHIKSVWDRVKHFAAQGKHKYFIELYNQKKHEVEEILGNDA